MVMIVCHIKKEKQDNKKGLQITAEALTLPATIPSLSL
jgi:hypothetical protein